MGEEHRVSIEEAMQRLKVVPDYDPGDGPQPCVHTIRGGGGVMLGAHWGLDEARAAMEKYGVEEAGGLASGMGHALVVVDDAGPVFFETGEDE